MLRKSSDYEERVLHFAREAVKPFCIQEIACETKVSATTVAGIISKFEMVGLVKMISLHPAQHYEYTETTRALSVPAIRRLFAYSDHIKEARTRKLQRDVEYDRTRQ